MRRPIAAILAFFFCSLLPAADAEKAPASLADIIEQKESPRLKEIALYPSKDAVRVVIVPTKKVDFKYDLLVGEGRDRIYIDLRDGTSADGFQPPKVESGGFLKAIRMGKRPDGIRIVFDIGTVEKYNVLVLDDPWRVVIDYIGGPPPDETPPTEPQRPILLPQKKEAKPAPSVVAPPPAPIIAVLPSTVPRSTYAPSTMTM